MLRLEEGRFDMKTTKRNIIYICLLAIASVVHAVEYKPFTKSAATLPSLQFRSTSVFSDQWAKDNVQPTLNMDGSVNTEAYGIGNHTTSSGPRRVDANGDGYDDDTGLPVNPIIDEDDEGNVPIGDAAVPLLLMALGYCAFRRWKKHAALTVIALLLMACSPSQPSFPPATKRYSQEVINARMSEWFNKDNVVGFTNVNSTNGKIEPATYASWDYVPGVVAKGILDVWEYYQDSTWADAWYEGLCAWGLSQTATNHGGILDDLNCTKVFLGLYEGAKPGGRFENAEHAAYFMEQLRRGAQGLAEHKHLYSIASGGAEGGWMHKATADPTQSYYGQMWCDGAYMGPALLAQLLVSGATEGTALSWNDVYDQFHASWPYLWDAEKKLPYHVLFTDVTINRNARELYQAGHLYPCVADATIYHSEEFWGRAAGWYILALVDVLEAYLQNLEASGEWKKGEPLPSAQNFDELRDYLTQLADGLVARQDPATGCWYQLLQYDGAKCATQGIDDTGSSRFTNVDEGGTQCNYLESSASCLITAALLKGSRLGFIHHMEAGKRGFEGIVRQFLRGEEGTYTITSSCQSAGLSHDRNGTAAYYLIGKDVPIQDNTEGKVLGPFLMAALEFERCAE